jgi:hypothetical protein
LTRERTLPFHFFDLVEDRSGRGGKLVTELGWYPDLGRLPACGSLKRGPSTGEKRGSSTDDEAQERRLDALSIVEEVTDRRQERRLWLFTLHLGDKIVENPV